MYINDVYIFILKIYFFFILYLNYSNNSLCSVLGRTSEKALPACFIASATVSDSLSETSVPFTLTAKSFRCTNG